MTTPPDPADDLQSILAQKVMLIATQAGIGIRMPNAPFDEPADGSVWGEYHLMLGKTKRAELGGASAGLQRQVGIIQFDFYVQENTGDGPISRSAGKFKAAFNEVTIPGSVSGSYARTQALSSRPMGKDLAPRGFYRWCVDGPIDLWFHDLRAQVVTS